MDGLQFGVTSDFRSDADGISWITINGQHVPVRNGSFTFHDKKYGGKTTVSSKNIADLKDRVSEDNVNKFLSSHEWNKKGLDSEIKEANELNSSIGRKHKILSFEDYCKDRRLSQEDEDSQEEWMEYASNEYDSAVEAVRDYVRKESSYEA